MDGKTDTEMSGTNRNDARALPVLNEYFTADYKAT